MTATEQNLLEDFKKEMKLLIDNKQRIVFDIGLIEAWAILCSIQLALRHPEYNRELSNIAREIALNIEAMLSPFGPAIREVAKRGWNPQYDFKAQS